MPRVISSVKKLGKEVKAITPAHGSDVVDVVADSVRLAKTNTRRRFWDAEVHLGTQKRPLKEIPKGLHRYYNAAQTLAQLATVPGGSARIEEAKASCWIKNKHPTPTAILEEVERKEPIDMDARLRHVIDGTGYRVGYVHCEAMQAVLKYLFRASSWQLKWAVRKLNEMIKELIGLRAHLLDEISKREEKVKGFD